MQTRGDIVSQFVELRRRRGLSQERLEVLSGISQQTISHMETGKAEPRIDSLIALANTLHAHIVLVADEEVDAGRGGRPVAASALSGQADLPVWTGVDRFVIPDEAPDA